MSFSVFLPQNHEDSQLSQLVIAKISLIFLVIMLLVSVGIILREQEISGLIKLSLNVDRQY